MIAHSDIMKCRFRIINPDHYRVDGACKCDDVKHRMTMIADWGYKASDFDGLPVRKE